MKKGFMLLVVMLLMTASTLLAQMSNWVYFGPNDQLQYRADDQGNRIMDFSSAGYKGGGIQLPDVPVAVKISPVRGDNTTNIQAAINAVSQLSPDSDGFRGAVLLAEGTYDVAGTVTIATSGVVLRGSGSGADGTIINLTGNPHRFLEIRGSGTWQTVGRSAFITDSYVPSGTNTFNVDDASGFSVGDTVLISRPVTAAWVRFMRMDMLVRSGQPQTWLRAGSSIKTDRVIQSISENQITLDVPLTDSFDAQFLNPPGATMTKYTFAGRISQVGVESLSVTAPPPRGGALYMALRMSAVIDAWARDIAIQETDNSVSVDSSAKQVTLDSISVAHTATPTGAPPADFSVNGTQVFVNRCSSTRTGGSATWPFVTGATATGPIVVLNFFSDQRSGISPHQRWATGLLADNCYLPNSPQGTPGIAYSNRGTAGSGHGWDMGWAVAWNVTSPFLLLEQPPGAKNWCIGCVGTTVRRREPVGIFDSQGAPVTPSSLYLAQLRERLGDDALVSIGYGDYRLACSPRISPLSQDEPGSETGGYRPYSQHYHER